MKLKDVAVMRFPFAFRSRLDLGAAVCGAVCGALCGVVLVGSPLLAQDVSSPELGDFDARQVLKRSVDVGPTAGQKLALKAFESSVPSLAVDFETSTGVARSLRSHTGYLTPANPDLDPAAIAIDQIVNFRPLLGLTPEDLSGLELTDRV